eukprot:GFUD01051271.1.p1 GENE.GFUD01051271.1~~GFUD01051271.1.p1  ORF type:complete len:551 (-),score=122.42 GFUD01051271.1:56-1708(-)
METDQMDQDDAAQDTIEQMDMKQCFICSYPAFLQCQKCEHVAFCSEEHGRLHSREGFADCFPYRVGFTEGVGRQIITTRDIRMGEVIYVEDPIVVGPSQECDAICLSCMSAIDTSYVCGGCGYPFCDEECAADPVHDGECQVLCKAPLPVIDGTQNTAYHPILPLRLLLQRSQDETKARLCEELMDHKEERKGSEYWEFSQKHIIQFLRESCKQSQWTEEEIMNAIGILEVNAYEIKSFLTSGYRGLFPLASLVSHQCVQNCRMVWNTEAPYDNKVVAAQDLKAGEEIASSYLRPSMCSLVRRKTLKEGWYFDCECSRCQDPTELGCHANTLLCPACGTGHMYPLHPLDYNSVWVCKCGHEETSQAVTGLVQGFLDEIKTVYENDRYNVSQWLDMYARAKVYFHPQHEVISEIAKWSVPILGRGPGKKLSDFPVSLIKTKVELATSYLAVLDIVERGVSKFRAKTLYELVDSQIYLASLDFRDGKCDRATIKILTKGFIRKLDEVLSIMTVLGVNSGYEEIIKGGADTLKQMCQKVLSVPDNLGSTKNES